MSEHLPECPHANSRTATFYGGYCVCPLLRACEQRAEAGAYNAGYVDGSKDAREGAFYEAREAVIALLYPNCSHIDGHEALAAIDALRGDP